MKRIIKIAAIQSNLIKFSLNLTHRSCRKNWENHWITRPTCRRRRHYCIGDFQLKSVWIDSFSEINLSDCICYYREIFREGKKPTELKRYLNWFDTFRSHATSSSWFSKQMSRACWFHSKQTKSAWSDNCFIPFPTIFNCVCLVFLHFFQR